VCKNLIKKEIKGDLFNLIYFPSYKTKMIISISKKLGKAILRNKIKRRIRESFKNQKIDKLNLKIIVKKEARSAKYLDINNELKNLIHQIKF